MENKSFLETCLTRKVKVVEERMTERMVMGEAAAIVMECMKRRMSATLFEVLCQMLVGFRKEEQRMMAAHLLTFARKKVATKTGRLSVDMVLNICYVLMEAERGKVKTPIKNALIAQHLIELDARKEGGEERQEAFSIQREPECAKTRLGIEVRKCCCTCRFAQVGSEGLKLCEKSGAEMEGEALCSCWMMAPCFENIGSNQGRVKSKRYLEFVLQMRMKEAQDMEAGLLDEEDCKTVEELREEFERSQKK